MKIIFEITAINLRPRASVRLGKLICFTATLWLILGYSLSAAGQQVSVKVCAQPDQPTIANLKIAHQRVDKLANRAIKYVCLSQSRFESRYQGLLKPDSAGVTLTDQLRNKIRHGFTGGLIGPRISLSSEGEVTFLLGGDAKRTSPPQELIRVHKGDTIFSIAEENVSQLQIEGATEALQFSDTDLARVLRVGIWLSSQKCFGANWNELKTNCQLIIPRLIGGLDALALSDLSHSFSRNSQCSISSGLHRVMSKKWQKHVEAIQCKVLIGN